MFFNNTNNPESMNANRKNERSPLFTYLHIRKLAALENQLTVMSQVVGSILRLLCSGLILSPSIHVVQ